MELSTISLNLDEKSFVELESCIRIETEPTLQYFNFK